MSDHDQQPGQPEPKQLPLDGWHRNRGGRMVEFAGYSMPVQYEGIMAEHLWTRENAGLFDVSHMGQLFVHGPDVDSALETLLPGELKALPDRKLRYSLLLDDSAGIIDDLMATRRGQDFYLVVNGATKHGDIEVMRQVLPKDIILDHMTGQALLALQGPKAADVLEAIIPGVSELGFMEGNAFHAFGHPLWISRSGYTGEDGFEISIPAVAAENRRFPLPIGEYAPRFRKNGLQGRGVPDLHARIDHQFGASGRDQQIAVAVAPGAHQCDRLLQLLKHLPAVHFAKPLDLRGAQQRSR